MTNIEFYTSNNFQFYIQCGLKNYNDFSDEFKKSKNIIIKPFINNISRIYSASDLVVSRAGALAITELCYMKKAMILIPFKFAANNLSTFKYFAKRAAGIIPPLAMPIMHEKFSLDNLSANNLQSFCIFSQVKNDLDILKVNRNFFTNVFYDIF